MAAVSTTGEVEELVLTRFGKKDNNVMKIVLPENFDSLEEFWGFWDTHSSADYEDLMETVEVDIELSSSKI